jgi:hypothetical protein
MTTNLENVGKLLAVISQIKTPSFVRIMNYSNAKGQGEVANYLINLGISYANAKEADTIWLSNPLNIVDVEFGTVKAFAKQAWGELLEARTNPNQATKNRSQAQTDAYITVCPNVRVHKESGRVFIYGLVVSKEIVIEGKYDQVASSAVTIAKRKIGKHLKAENFRQVAFDKLQLVKAKGETIEITIG